MLFNILILLYVGFKRIRQDERNYQNMFYLRGKLNEV